MGHAPARPSGGTDKEVNLQCLCLACHQAKTTCEQTSTLEDVNPLASRCSKVMCESFVMRRKTPQCVAGIQQPNGGPLLDINVLTCRFSQMVEHVHGLPIYKPTGAPFRASPGELGHFQWYGTTVGSL